MVEFGMDQVSVVPADPHSMRRNLDRSAVLPITPPLFGLIRELCEARVRWKPNSRELEKIVEFVKAPSRQQRLGFADIPGDVLWKALQHEIPTPNGLVPAMLLCCDLRVSGRRPIIRREFFDRFCEETIGLIEPAEPA